MRADLYLHLHGYSESRTKAAADIKNGFLYVNGINVLKSSFEITDGDEVELKGTSTVFVGRGGEKLEKAINVFGVEVTGKVCVDVGASTGGFTDCLLRHGACKVYAVDCGHGQLHPKLISDSRVVNIEKFNARNLTEETLGEKCDIAVMDVSFISQTALLPAVGKVLKDGGLLVSLIKPQFECGKECIGKNGVVKNTFFHKEAVNKVLLSASENSFMPADLCVSPVKGGDGNTEYLALFSYRCDAEKAVPLSELTERIFT